MKVTLGHRFVKTTLGKVRWTFIRPPARFSSIFHGIIASLPQLSVFIARGDSRFPRNLNATRPIRLIRIETFYARFEKEEEEEEEEEKMGEEERWIRNTGICKAVGASPNAGAAIESKSSSLETRIVVITDFPCAQEYSI